VTGPSPRTSCRRRSLGRIRGGTGSSLTIQRLTCAGSSSTPGPEHAGTDDFASSDRQAALRTALDGLPKRQRAIVVLRYHEDMSEAQVAHALGVSVGTVKSQASRALAKLRDDAALVGYGAVTAGGE